MNVLDFDSRQRSSGESRCGSYSYWEPWGASTEASTVRTAVEEAQIHYWIPFTRIATDPLHRFVTSYDDWKNATRFVSDMNEICMNPAYQAIIGMGSEALPYIFAMLRKEPDYWFWALKAITLHDPVLEADRGRIDRMTQHWLAWAEKYGF